MNCKYENDIADFSVALQNQSLSRRPWKDTSTKTLQETKHSQHTTDVSQWEADT